MAATLWTAAVFRRFCGKRQHLFALDYDANPKRRSTAALHNASDCIGCIDTMSRVIPSRAVGEEPRNCKLRVLLRESVHCL